MIHPDRITPEFQQLGSTVIGPSDAAYGNVNAIGSQRCFVAFAEIASLTIGVRKQADRAPGPLRHLAYGRLNLFLTALLTFIFEDAMGVAMCSKRNNFGISSL